MTSLDIETWLSACGLIAPLHLHVAEVLTTLPSVVRDDLLRDPAFRLCDYETGAGLVVQVPVGRPSRRGAGRSVALKRTLCHRPSAFVRWVIAHEFAHAHLRNGGRWPGDDPELAADALAAEWGFPRPA